MNVNKTLVGRAVEFCNNTNIDLLKYILDDKYATSAKCSIKNNFCFKLGHDGLIDIVRNLLYHTSYDYEKRDTVNLLLRAF